MASTENPDILVEVALTGDSHDDAEAVFEALRAAFPSDRDASEAPQPEVDDARPTIWTAAYEVREAPQGEPGTTSLTAPVTATVQGGYRAVEVLRGVLEGAFAVHEKGTAFGDQEKEIELVLASR